MPEGLQYPPEALGIDTEVIFQPDAGRALTANTLMMRENKTFHRYPEVIKAMAECVARGGFGTSVTPVSQFYFQQAYANVMMGPWKKMTEGYGNMVLGYFRQDAGRARSGNRQDCLRAVEENRYSPAIRSRC